MKRSLRIDKLVITDPGIDDAGALLYLNKHIKNNFLILSSFGNVPEYQSYLNLLKLKKVFPMSEKWQIMRGPNRPLDSKYSQYAKKAIYNGNGTDGLWGLEIDTAKYRTDENINKIDLEYIDCIYSLASLTGLVLLARKGVKGSEVLIMGGAFGGGNVRPLDNNGEYADDSPAVAEWNIFKDPEAAKEYFSVHAGAHTYVVPKDVCMKVLFSVELILNKSTLDTSENRFMSALLKRWVNGYAFKNTNIYKRGLMLADLVAVIIFENKEIAEWEKNGVQVITEIGPDLGRTLLSEINPHCNIAVDIIDKKRLLDEMHETIFGIKSSEIN